MQELNNNYSRDKKATPLLGKYYLSVIVGLIFIIYTTSGYTGEKANFVSIGLCLFWLVVSCFINLRVFTSIFLKKKVVFFILFLLFYLTTSLPTAGIYDTFKYIGTFIILFSPMFMYSYYERLGNIRLLKIVVYSVYIVWFIFAVKALCFYYKTLVQHVGL